MVTHFKNICKLCQNAQCGHSHIITQKGVPKGANPCWCFSYSIPTCFKCAHISVCLSLRWLLYIIKISFLTSMRAFIDCPLSTHLLSLLLFPFIIFLRLLLFLLFFGTLHSDAYAFPFLLCFSLLSFSQLFVRPPQTAILLFCIFFSMGMVLIPVSCTMSRTSVHSSSGTLSDLGS